LSQDKYNVFVIARSQFALTRKGSVFQRVQGLDFLY